MSYPENEPQACSGAGGSGGRNDGTPIGADSSGDDDSRIRNMLELQFGVSYVRLEDLEVPTKECWDLLPKQFITEKRVLPVRKRDRVVTIVMTNPNDLSILDELKARLKGCSIKLGVCLEDEFQAFIERVSRPEVKAEDSPIKSSPGITLLTGNLPGIVSVKVYQREARYALSWDRYMRLSQSANAVLSALESATSATTRSILDVGGFDGALALFLPEEYDIFLLDPLTTGGSGTNISAPESSFDVVVSVDALEHVVPSSRRKFVSELCRVSRNHVIINYPSASSQPAQEVVFQLTGNPYIGEHVQYGLPDTAVVLQWLSEEGLVSKCCSHTSIATWMAHFTLSSVNPNAGKLIGAYLIDSYDKSGSLYDLITAQKAELD